MFKVDKPKEIHGSLCCDLCKEEFILASGNSKDEVLSKLQVMGNEAKWDFWYQGVGESRKILSFCDKCKLNIDIIP